MFTIYLTIIIKLVIKIFYHGRSNKMKRQIYIGNIYKMTKEKVNYEKEIVIKNSGIDALICGEDYGLIPPSIQIIDTRYEIYKKNAILIKLSDETDLISKFVVLDIRNNKIVIDKKNIILSVPFYLNSLFVDEKSIQPYFYKNKKELVKVLKNKGNI